MSLGVYGFGCEDALAHLMNYVWPNVFENSPHLVQAFMDAVDGMRVSLGPAKVLSYVVQVSQSDLFADESSVDEVFFSPFFIVFPLQGLFHPARKVRDVYWKIYNTLYIGSQDALVASYPRIPDDAKNTYARHELDYVL